LNWIDGQNKSKLGANAILGVSLAVAKAAANEWVCHYTDMWVEFLQTHCLFQ
jgi:enolase